MDTSTDDHADYEHLLGDLNIASARFNAQPTAKQTRAKASEPTSSDESYSNSGDSADEQELEEGSQDASSDEQGSYDSEDANQSPGSEDVDDYLQNYMEQAALQSLLQTVHGANAELQLANQLYAASIASSGASPATTFTKSMPHFLPHEPDEVPNKQLRTAGSEQRTEQASTSQFTSRELQQHAKQQKTAGGIEAATSLSLTPSQQHDKQKRVSFLEPVDEENGEQADDEFEWFEELPTGAPLPKVCKNRYHSCLIFVRGILLSWYMAAASAGWTHVTIISNNLADRYIAHKTSKVLAGNALPATSTQHHWPSHCYGTHFWDD